MIYDFDTPAVRHLIDCDPILSEVILSVGPVSLTQDSDPFKSLVFAIIGQQLSMKAADTISGRVEALLGEVSPECILSTSNDLLRGSGLSGSKVEYLFDLSRRCVTGDLDLASMSYSGDEEVVQSLTQVKGIGCWTAEMFLIFALGREDVFSWGDGGLHRALRVLYGDMVDDSEGAAEQVGLWRPYRSIASLYLWKTLESNATGR